MPPDSQDATPSSSTHSSFWRTRFNVGSGKLGAEKSRLELTLLRTLFSASRLGRAAVTAVVALINAMVWGSGSAQAADPAPATPAPAPGTQPATSNGSATPLPEVDVTGSAEYKADSLSLQKLSEPLLTLPQSASVVTKQVMADQGVTTLRDSLRNVAGVSIGAGEGSYQGDNISVRGFAARSDIYLDGMSDFGSYNRDPFNLEQVEVLKGPSSAVFGRGAAGGVVNQESKQPLLQNFVAGSLQYGTDQTKAGTLDVNELLPGVPNAAFRVNVMGHDSDVTDRDDATYKRFGIAPSLAFGINTPTRLTISYFHQQEDNVPDYGIPWLNDRPAPVARNNYYGFSNDYLKTNVNIGTIKFEHDFNDTFSLHEQFRLGSYYRSFRISQADTSFIPAGTPLNQAQVERDIIDGVSTDRLIDEDINLVSKFSTGAIKHTLITGFEFVQQSVDPRRIEPNWENVPNTSLLYPSGAIPFPGTGTTGTEVNATVQEISAYATDTMKIGHDWTLIAGARYDHAASTYFESVPPTEALNADDAAVTWRAAIEYQPRENGSIYVSSGTSFHPNIEQLSISSEPTLPANTKDVAVGKDFEVEVGTKWDLFDHRLQLSGALFWDEQTNPAPVDLDDPLIDVLHGKERVRGIELGAVGHLTDKWLIIASYTLQDSAVISSSDPTMLGNPVLNCPKNMGSLWTTYEMPWNFQIGGGMNAVSSRTADLSTDPATGLVQGADGYVIFNAMVKYHVNPHVDLQVNLDNIADKFYIDGVHPGHAVPGPGRTLYVSMNFKF